MPPWIGSGQPFLAASHAADYNGHLGSDPFRTVVGRGIDLQVLPALLAAIIAVAVGWLRDRDRVAAGDRCRDRRLVGGRRGDDA